MEGVSFHTLLAGNTDAAATACWDLRLCHTVHPQEGTAVPFSCPEVGRADPGTSGVLAQPGGSGDTAWACEEVWA